MVFIRVLIFTWTSYITIKSPTNCVAAGQALLTFYFIKKCERNMSLYQTHPDIYINLVMSAC